MNMKKTTIILVLGLLPFVLMSQNPNGNYNPFVESSSIYPAPLLPSEEGGEGVLSFTIGNKGSDELTVHPRHYLILTLTLSNLEPVGTDPLAAIGGDFSVYFSWTYLNGTFSAVQIADIPSEVSGTIEIAIKVAGNSISPGSNGFNINITPAPYQTTSNQLGDDAISAYTFTDKSSSLNELESAVLSVYPNPTNGDIRIELAGEEGEFLFELIALDGSIHMQKKVYIGTVSTNLRIEEAPGLYTIRMSQKDKVYLGSLVIEE